MMSMTADRLPAIGGGRLLIAFVFLQVAACSPSATPVGKDAEPPPAEVVPADDVGPQVTTGPQSAEEITPNTLPDDELTDGWISLFDGQSLFGWKAAGDADWRVEDGAIVVESGEKCLLCTTSQFSDYVLRVDFRCAPSTNSGIFLHTPLKPLDPASDCYELNIAGPENPFPTGSLVLRKKAEIEPVSGDWHSYEVTLNGADVLVRLDGQQIIEYADPKPLKRGHIGLQLNEGKVAFRNIKLKPLGAASLYNGQDLSGWKTYPDMASKFTVDDRGNLTVRDGRGQLETESVYGDFLLQLQCKTEAAGLNSGVFFRCIPGDVMMGYECQIHNGFQDGDRTKPEDCGTGGIFRRQDARCVVADDLTWFFLTLVADGPHMAAWVNGFQVSDWTDDRQPDANPRKGLRLEPGSIMIQGHDPTTHLSFRNLSILEFAERQSPEATEQ
jgi:hypothetical protein